MSNSVPEIRVTPVLHRHFKAAVEAAVKAVDYLANQYYKQINKRNEALKQSAQESNKGKIKTKKEIVKAARNQAYTMLKTKSIPDGLSVKEQKEAIAAHWVWKVYCLHIFADPSLSLSLPDYPLEDLTNMLEGSLDPLQADQYSAKHSYALGSLVPLRVFHHYTANVLKEQENLIRGKVESKQYNEFPEIPPIPQELLDGTTL